MSKMKIIWSLSLALLVVLSCAEKEVEKDLPPVKPVVEYAVAGNAMTVDVDAAVDFVAKVVSEGPVQCEWYLDGVLMASTASFRYVFSHVGKYTALFKAFNEAGSEERSYEVTVVGIPLTIDFTPEGEKVSCVMLEQVAFKANVTAGGKGVTHSWTLDGTLAGSEAEFSFTPAAAGTYTVTYTGTNADEFTVTRSWTVEADELPLEVVVSNTGNEIIVVAGSTVELSAEVRNGGKGIVHSWTLDGTSVSTTAEFSYEFTQVGSFSLLYKAVNAKGESFEHSWAVKVQEASSEVAYMYLDFEDGKVPDNMSGNSTSEGKAFKVIDNPYKTPANSSSKVLVDDMQVAGWSTSGYIDLKDITFEGRKKAKILRVKVYIGAADYYPYLQIMRDTQPKSLPKVINGVELAPKTAETFNSIVKRNDWNVFEYYVEDFGYENFQEITQFQLRPFSKWNGSNCDAAVSATNPKIVWYDDIEFVE